jgi:hypothetical protein
MNNAGIEGCRAMVHGYPTEVFDKVSLPTALLVNLATLAGTGVKIQYSIW